MKNPKDLFKFDQLNMMVAYGEATYQMSRGTFKTKDKIKNKFKLMFKHFDQSIYWYETDGKKVGIAPTLKNNHLEIKIINQTDFNRFWLELPSDSNEHFYGCGEQFTHFDLKHKAVNIWVSEHHSVKKILKKFLREKIFGVNPNHIGPFKDQQTYYAQPTFLSSYKYLIHSESNAYQTYDFKSDKTVLFYREIPKKIHMLYDDQFLDIASATKALLGHQPALPKWTDQGLIIASQGGISSIENHLKNAESAGIKVVGVWSQDWSGSLTTSFGYQVYWNWKASDTLYPNLKDYIQKLKQKNIAFLGYINTFLKEDTELYKEAKEKQFFVKNKDDQVYHIKSTTFNAGIIDLTHPKAYQWYKEIIKKEMIGIGMMGWMADFGEYLPTDAKIFDGDPRNMHNVWPSLWAKLNHEAIIESKKEHELFFFTRAGYTDTIKHSNTMWAGDQHVDFSKEYGLPSAVVSALSMATIGIGVTHSDIGGYTTILHMKRSKELLIRWLELNIFSPIIRCHEGNQPDKNVQFDHDKETLDIFSKLTNAFIKLSPYLNHLKEEHQQNGYPIIRPVFYHYDEPWAYTEQYQFMYGDEIIVCPVIESNCKEMDIILPNCHWIQLGTNIPFDGGTHHIETPLGKPIAFYKADGKFRELFSLIKF